MFLKELRKASSFIDKHVNNVIENVITPSKDHIATQYTSDYNYSRFIPPPCQWYNNKKPGECCSLDVTTGKPEPHDKTDEQPSRTSECDICDSKAMKEKLCIYTLETIQTDRLKKDLNNYHSEPLKTIMKKVREEFKSNMTQIKKTFKKTPIKTSFLTMDALAKGFSITYYNEYDKKPKIKHIGTTDDRIGNNYYAAREMIKLFTDNKSDAYISNIEVFDKMINYISNQISKYGRFLDGTKRVFNTDLAWPLGDGNSDILGNLVAHNWPKDNEYDNRGWVGNIMQSVEGLYSYKDLIMGGRPSKSNCAIPCSSKTEKDKCKLPRCTWNGSKCTESVNNDKHMLFGSRYFIKNGLKCRNKDDEMVPAYNYMNSISENKSLSESMLDDISDLNLDKLKPILDPPESSTNAVPRCSYITKSEGIHSPKFPNDCSQDEKSYRPGIHKCIINKTRPTIKDVSIIETFNNIDINNTKTINNNTNDICNCNFKLYMFFIILFMFLCFLNFYVF